MTSILAIDTATDACSVALYKNDEYHEIYEVIPRQHSRRLMPMLQQLLSTGNLRSLEVDAIAYGAGPGSFTGLRIAASAVQGLAFANNLPAVAVSSLAAQAQTALRMNLVATGEFILSTVDARIQETYWALFSTDTGLPVLQSGPGVGRWQELDVVSGIAAVHGVGSGFQDLELIPVATRERLRSVHPQVLPSARDIIPFALEKYAAGETLSAAEVQPVYVREEVSWKKLSEQGKGQ